MEIDARLRRHLRDEITVWDAERLRAMPREEFALFASLIDVRCLRFALKTASFTQYKHTIHS